MTPLRAHTPDPFFDHVVLTPEQHHRLHNARMALATLQSALSTSPGDREADISIAELTGFLSLVLEPLDTAISAEPLPRFLVTHPRRR